MGGTEARPRITVRVLALLLAALPAVAGPAFAEDGGGMLDSALEFMNLKTQPGAMPDFVQQSRHDLSRDSYMPVGQKPVGRDVKAKTPAEVKALTADLDAARAAQLAGKRPAPFGAKAGSVAKVRSTAKAGGTAEPGEPLPLNKAQQATNH